MKLCYWILQQYGSRRGDPGRGFLSLEREIEDMSAKQGSAYIGRN